MARFPAGTGGGKMTQKVKAYQQIFKDGFGTNRLLKKPKTRGGLIYTTVDPDTVMTHGGCFLPTWDGTDHFHFVCRRCKTVADILQVIFNPNYGGGVKYSLHFILGCPRCGITGQRKIYLDIRDKACKFQQTFDEHKMFIYGDKREPERIIEIGKKKEQK